MYKKIYHSFFSYIRIFLHKYSINTYFIICRKCKREREGELIILNVITIIHLTQNFLEMFLYIYKFICIYIACILNLFL